MKEKLANNLKIPTVPPIVIHFILFHNKIFIFSCAKKIILKLRF